MVELIQIRGTQVEIRPCGECSLCCKLLDIGAAEGFPFEKPAGQWCPHCSPGKGCQIRHTDFPDVCHSYQCAWKFPRVGLPEEMRPDKVHAIFELDDHLPNFPNDAIVHVTCDYKNPSAQTSLPRLMDYLEEQTERGLSFVVNAGPFGLAISKNPQIQAALAERAEKKKLEREEGKTK